MSFSAKKDHFTYRGFIEKFEQAKDRALEFCQPIDHDIFVQRPAEGSWSIAECYSHLHEFGEQYLKKIRSGLNDASGKVPDINQSFKPRIVWKGIIWIFEPPYKLKMKTFEPFEPKSKADLNKEKVLDDFLQLQHAFIHELKLAEADRLDLNAVKVSNPISNFVKMKLSECFAIVEVHQRRHMWQAEQVLGKVRV